MGHASWRDAAVRATDLPLSPGDVAANAAGTAPQPRHVLRHAGAVRWFTHNPVLMGCLPPILLYLGIGVAAVLTAGAFGLPQAILILLAAPFYRTFGLIVLVAAVWLFVVWAVYFGRRRS